MNNEEKLHSVFDNSDRDGVGIWTVIPEDHIISSTGEKVILEEKNVEWSAISVVRASAIIKGKTSKEIAYAIYNLSFEERKKLLDDLMSYEIIETIDNDSHIVLARYRAPWGVSNREFLTHRGFFNIDNDYVITTCPIEHEKAPINPNFVRGTNDGIMYIKYIDENSTKIITVDHIEPKGWVPSYLVNSYKSKAAKRLQAIQEIINNKST
jgi:hypothetical protein